MPAKHRQLVLRLAASGTSLLACAVLQARGADLVPERAGRTEQVDFADWSGASIGLQGSAGSSFGNFGFGAGEIGRRSVPNFRTGDGTGRNDPGRNATTALGGVFGGYSWQTGPYVYGFEADISASNLKRPVSSTVQGFGFENADSTFSLIHAKTDLFGSARARLGYAFERYLVYASFGLAGAQTRLMADFPDLGEGPTSTTRRNFLSAGFTLGAGIQYAITPNLALGLEYRYLDLGQSRRFILGSLPGISGGLFSTQASFSSNQVLARLLWYPSGLTLPPDSDRTAPQDPKNGDTDRFSLHGQTTFIEQGVTGFRSPYLGSQSLVPHQAAGTLTATAFLGFKLLEGTELYYNPEFDQGFGLSRTLGVAGFVNGEAQKAGAAFPKLRSQRYFLRQIFGLGGETETVPDGPNQIATTRDVERITVIAGKFAIGDFFDGNIYAHDPRVDFWNWAMWASAAWDFPANLPGFTQGVIVEYNQKNFAIRAAYAQVPKEPSSNVLDPRILQKGGLNAELEVRYSVLNQAGRLRFGAFSNEGRTANYREAVTLSALDPVAFPDANAAALANRKDRNKSGGYINLEQALTPTLGMFARVSASDGRNESLSFADVDRSASGGFSLKGVTWGRPNDAVGMGAAINGISRSHRDFFANGGLGLVIGDGRLRYGPEKIAEAYYAFSLTKTLTISLDYQFVANPAYNKDRGPAHFLGTRLHADF